MSSDSSNFLHPSSATPWPDQYYKPSRGRRVAKLFIIISLIAAIAAAVATAYQVAAPKNDLLASALRQMPVVREFAQWLRPDLRLINTDTLPIVIAGISGVGNDGPLLTDTLIVAVLKPKTGQFGLISIPRDLAVATSAGSFQKVNSVYALAEAKHPGSGLGELSGVVATITGLPTNKAVVINFRGFEELINAFDGVTVDIKNSFVDNSYPDGRGGVKTVSFSAGRQRLTGEQALEFARSRHGSNGENSDFARAKRQQQLIVALADEALKLRTLTSPRRLQALNNLLSKYINTNMDIGEAVELAGQFQNTDPLTAPRLVIDDSPNGFLLNTIGPDGAFLLTPRGGNFSAIQKAINNLFNEPINGNEEVRLEVKNGTNIAGFAQTIADQLQREKFQVIYFGNAPQKNIVNTVIYDYTNGQKSAAASRLQQLLPGSLIMQGDSSVTTTAHFIIILGQKQGYYLETVF